ncbi:MAG: hypothetical protein JO158_00225 [Gammaproteobacteria bacterium]|nr:hypothetical protein [Gammaproteobacteria bacterium]MBV8974842.1 hypothetical protein [Nevskiaceae bacterium]MBV9727446.1 hypothetical protein [Gammaproteobacteria bacterium]
MKRAILALLAGLVLWVVAISVLNRALRIALAGYAAAEPTMGFTLGMLWSRLLIGALSSLLAGALARWIAPASPRVPLLLGILLLLAFIPVHLRLWSLFPLWYHLVFLGTLVPLIVLGSRLSPPRPMAAAPVRS